MKIIWFTVISGLAILLSFQNCQKSQSPDELQFYSKNGIEKQGDPLTVNLANQKLSTIEFTSRENEQIVRNGTVFTIVTDNIYQLDLVTGRMKSDSEFTQVQKYYCLTDSLKNELNSILKASSVCAIQKTSVADEACTQVLQPGYAKIMTVEALYDLGSASDGCGNHAIDLCGDNSTLLKGFISHLKSQLSSISCD